MHVLEHMVDLSLRWVLCIVDAGQSDNRETEVFIISGGTPSLRDLLKELKLVASKWENLGIMLGIDSGFLDNISADNPKNCDNCLREMLKVWLKQVEWIHHQGGRR